jgi:hypothetical protein
VERRSPQGLGRPPPSNAKMIEEVELEAKKGWHWLRPRLEVCLIWAAVFVCTLLAAGLFRGLLLMATIVSAAIAQHVILRGSNRGKS